MTGESSVEPVTARAGTQPIDPRRRLGALPEAITAELRRAGRPGMWVGMTIFAGLLAVLVLLSRAIPELGWLGDMPAWLVAVLIGFGASLVTTIVDTVAVPRRVADGWVALTWIAIDGRNEWRRRTGTALPDSVAGMERWLDEHPETNANRLDRATLLLALDRPRDADRELAAHEPEGADQAFLGAQLRWFSAFMAELADAPLLDRCRELVGAYPAGSRDRRVAEAAVGHLAAAQALALDGPWLDPLTDARRALGPLARGVAWRYLVLPRLLAFAIAGTVISGVLLAAQLVLGM